MNDTDRLDVLWEERAVRSVILTFGRCLDLGDWAGWQSCFTEEVNVDFKRLTGFDEFRASAKVWTDFVAAGLTPMRRHHTYTNFDITVDSDRAQAVVYMTARHWASTDLGVSHNTQYGWYDFYLERIDSRWLVAKYKHDFQWIDGNAGILDVHAPELAERSAAVFNEAHFDAARAHVFGPNWVHEG